MTRPHLLPLTFAALLGCAPMAVDYAEYPGYNPAREVVLGDSTEVDPATGLTVSVRDSEESWRVKTLRNDLTGEVDAFWLESPTFYAAEDLLSGTLPPPTLHNGNLQVDCKGVVSFLASARKRGPSVREWKNHVEFLRLDAIGELYERRRVAEEVLQFNFELLHPVEFAFGKDVNRTGGGIRLFTSADDSWIDEGRLLAIKSWTQEEARTFYGAIYRLRLTDRDRAAVGKFKASHCQAVE